MRMHVYLAATVVVVVASCCNLASADTLPATVVSGYTISENAINEGTTLEVTKMLQSAKDAGNRTAIFTARNLTFAATLDIAFPAEDALPAFAIPIAISLLDGTTFAAFTQGPHISITGSMRRGSSLVIVRGQFAFANYFLYLASSFVVSDGSTVSVVGGTFQPVPSSTESLFGSNLTVNLTVSNNSQVLIEGNIFEVTTTGIFVPSVSCVQLTSSSIGLEGNSGLHVRNNSIRLDDTRLDDTQLGSANVHAIILAQSPLIIADNSSLVIEGTSLRASNRTTSGYVRFDAYNSLSSPCSISSGSTFAVLDTRVEMKDVREIKVYGFFVVESPFNISGASTLVFHNNNFSITNLKDLYPRLGLADFDVGSSLNVTGGSSVIIQQTSFIIQNGSSWQSFSSATWSANVLFTSIGASITVDSRSHVAITDTLFVAHNITTDGTLNNNMGTFEYSVINLDWQGPLSVSNNSTFIIANTVGELSNISVGHIQWTACVTGYRSPIDISADSVFSIENSSVTALGSNASFWIWLSLLRNSNAPVSVDRSSALRMSTSEFEVHDCFITRNPTSPNVSLTLLKANSPLQIDGNLSFVGSTLSNGSSVMSISFDHGGTISGTGNVLVERAVLGAGSEIVAAATMLDGSAPMFRVCDNLVGGEACVFINNINYPCATAISRRVSSCPSGIVSRTNVPTPTPLLSSSASPTLHRVSRTIEHTPTARMWANLTVRTTISPPTKLLSALLNVTASGTTILFANAGHPCSPIPSADADPGAVNETTCEVVVTPQSSAKVIEKAIAEGAIPGVYDGNHSPSPAPKPGSPNHTPLIVGVVVGCIAAVAILGIVIYCCVKRKGSSNDESAPFYTTIS